MPDEQHESKPEPTSDKRETKPSEIKAERHAPIRRSYVTEDAENPLICRGID